MSLKYHCLILDHDDTAVNSTAEIHYPAHLEIMRQLRPSVEPVSLEGWFQKNFHPGIMEYLINELDFTQHEIETEYKIWRDFTLKLIPHFYPGFIDFLHEYRSKGGIVAVVSHSEVEVIQKHYSINGKPQVFTPDIIFGWTYDEKKRKPNPYPVSQILSKFDLEKDDVLVVDDLKPGVLMGKAAGVSVVGAGWAHQIPEIASYMKENCLVYLESVEKLREFILN